jgi:predicted membrane metal-binding protein
MFFPRQLQRVRSNAERGASLWFAGSHKRAQFSVRFYNQLLVILLSSLGIIYFYFQLVDLSVPVDLKFVAICTRVIISKLDKYCLLGCYAVWLL